LLSTIVQIVGNGVIDVPVGQSTRNDGFGFHLGAPALVVAPCTRLRNPSK
jgi:hypothetical protein